MTYLDFPNERRPLTLEDLISNALILQLGGSDTTTSACVHILYHLALHHEVQSKLFAEISEVLPPGQPLDYGPIAHSNTWKLSSTRLFVCSLPHLPGFPARRPRKALVSEAFLLLTVSRPPRPLIHCTAILGTLWILSASYQRAGSPAQASTTSKESRK